MFSKGGAVVLTVLVISLTVSLTQGKNIYMKF